MLDVEADMTIWQQVSIYNDEQPYNYYLISLLQKQFLLPSVIKCLL